jgi:uncharacterized SAM-binding protein YcdF (DUF218 family)
VAKDLVEPLWLPLVILVGVWVYLWRTSRLGRWVKIIGTSALAGLWLACTPLSALLLERPLMVESTLEDGWSPRYIFVLSAGFDIADEPELDASGTETVRRVNRAVVLWRDYPNATLVMTGAQPGMHGLQGHGLQGHGLQGQSLRSPEQQGQLMQAQAQRLGVPAANIIIEAISLNTKGHAKQARDSALFAPDMALAIVTSDFHLRRARSEFSRYFNNIRMIGSDPVITDNSFSDISVAFLIPRVDAVAETTMYLREYVALALSDLRS